MYVCEWSPFLAIFVQFSMWQSCLFGFSFWLRVPGFSRISIFPHLGALCLEQETSFCLKLSSSARRVRPEGGGIWSRRRHSFGASRPLPGGYKGAICERAGSR